MFLGFQHHVNNGKVHKKADINIGFFVKKSLIYFPNEMIRNRVKLKNLCNRF